MSDSELDALRWQLQEEKKAHEATKTEANKRIIQANAKIKELMEELAQVNKDVDEVLQPIWNVTLKGVRFVGPKRTVEELDRQAKDAEDWRQRATKAEESASEAWKRVY